MNTTLSGPAHAAEEWLVVIDRLEASVFRSVQANAVPQVIRSQQPLHEMGTPRAATLAKSNADENFQPPGFFEPLVGVLHGARKILVVSRTRESGDDANQFVSWARAYHPVVGRRISAFLTVDSERSSEADILAKARVFYKRAEAIRSAFTGVRGFNLSATRRPLEKKSAG